MKVKLLAGVAMAGLFAAGAAAAEPNGWYGAIDAGWHMPDEVEANGYSFEQEDSWAAFARLGYRFTPNWRVELEGGYRDGGDFEAINIASSGAPAVCNVTPAAGACNAPDGDIFATSATSRGASARAWVWAPAWRG